MLKFLKDIFSTSEDTKLLENNGSLNTTRHLSLNGTGEVDELSPSTVSEEKYLEELVNKASTEESEVFGIPNDLQILAPGEQRQLESSMKGNKQLNNAGLFDSLEVINFYSQNFFSRGRHNGVNFGHEGSISMGEQNIIADFERVLNKMTSSRVAKLNEMNRHIESVPERFKGLADQVKGKSKIVMLEIDELSDQVVSCKNGQGWIFDAITKYNLGFSQGNELAINHKFKEA